MRWGGKTSRLPQNKNREHPDTKALNSNHTGAAVHPNSANRSPTFPVRVSSPSSAIHLSVVTSDKSVFAVGFAITATASQGLERTRAYPGPDEDLAPHRRERNSSRTTHSGRPTV